jgi:hypothetical protein
VGGQGGFPVKMGFILPILNELIAPGGKLSAKGYTNFADQHGTLDRVANLLNHSRSQAQKSFMYESASPPTTGNNPRTHPCSNMLPASMH